MTMQCLPQSRGPLSNGTRGDEKISKNVYWKVFQGLISKNKQQYKLLESLSQTVHCQGQNVFLYILQFNSIKEIYT